MADIAYKLICFANDIAKALFNAGFNFVTMNPETFANGNAYAFAKALNSIFVTLGVSFATILFLVDFCMASTDIKNEMRLPNIVKMYIKIGVCAALITFSMDILSAFIKSENALLNIVSGNVYLKETTSYGAPITSLFSGFSKPVGDMLADFCYLQKLPEVMKIASFWEAIIFTILALIVVLILAATGIYFCFTGIVRLFKIYTMLPFASFAFATFGARENSSIGSILPGYIKSFMGLLLENASIVIAVRLFFAFLTPTSIYAVTFLGKLGVSEANFTYFEFVMFCLLNAIACYAFFILIVTAAKDVPKHALGLGNL